MRRSRTEQLVLVRPDGERVVLAEQRRTVGNLTTQDVFQVSPDGAYLAYEVEGTLHVRAADGTERTLDRYDRLMRFSPDAKTLALTRAGHVVVLELATGETRELAELSSVAQLEWIRDGLVASAFVDRKHVLVEIPLHGAATTLLEGPRFERFAAAATGTRVVVFTVDASATHVIALDASAPAAAHELRVVHDPVINAAMSQDGEHLAFATALAVFTAAGDQRPEAISDRGNVHSLWFAQDGRLGYASSTSATILDAGRAQRFDRDGPIEMLRFDPLSKRALVATSTQAWDAIAAQRVAQAAHLLGVDHFAGGFVLWTAS